MQFSNDELSAIANVIGPMIPRLSGSALTSSFHEGANPQRESEIRRIFESADSLAARTMLQSWDATRGSRSLSGAEMRGLHALLMIILGDVRPPSGLRKGFAAFGLIENDGQTLYKARVKLQQNV